MSDIQFPSDIATVGGIEIQNLVKVCSVLRSYWDNIHVSNKHLLFPHNVGWKTVPGSSSGLCWKVWPYPTQRCQHGTFNECVKDQRSVQLQCLQMEQSQNCSDAHPSCRAKHLLHHNGMDNFSILGVYFPSLPLEKFKHLCTTYVSLLATVWLQISYALWYSTRKKGRENRI